MSIPARIVSISKRHKLLSVLALGVLIILIYEMIGYLLSPLRHTPIVAWETTCGPCEGGADRIAFSPRGSMFIVLHDNVLYECPPNDSVWIPRGTAPSRVGKLLIDRGNNFYSIPFRFGDSTTFRSTDSGKIWMPLADNVEDIAMDSTGALYLIGKFGISQSFDNGATWNLVETTRLNLKAITVSSNNEVFAGGYGAFIHSIDNGKSWQQLSIFPAWLRDIQIAGDNTLYCLSDCAILQSTDHAKTWDTVKNLPQSERISNFFITRKGSIILHSSSSWQHPTDKMFRSTDGGANWAEISPQPAPYGFGTMAMNNQGIIFLSPGFPATGGIWSLNEPDRDTAWEITVRTPGSSVRGLAQTHNGIILASTDQSIYLTKDYGAQWTRIYHCDTNARFGHIAIHPNGILVAAKHFLLRSTDNGTTWSKAFVRPDSNSFVSLVESPNNSLFLLERGGSAVTLYRSDDFGQHWTIRLTNSDSTGGLSSLFISRTQKIFLGKFRIGLFSSTDNGGTWKHIDIDNENEPKIDVIQIMESKAGQLIMEAFSFKRRTPMLFSSSDDGEHWRFLSYLNSEFGSWVVNNQGIITSSGGFSSVNGTGWRHDSGKLDGAPVLKLLDDGTIMAGTYWGGVYKARILKN